MCRDKIEKVLVFLSTADAKKKEPHIKKPLNAFMIYMKDMRPVVQAECTLKESAAINQLLGRRVRTAISYKMIMKVNYASKYKLIASVGKFFVQ